MKFTLVFLLTTFFGTNFSFARDTVCKSTRDHRFDFAIKVVSGRGQRSDQVRLTGLISGKNYNDSAVSFKVNLSTQEESFILLRLDSLSTFEKNKRIYMKIGKHTPTFKAIYFEMGTDSLSNPSELLVHAKRRSEIELNCQE